MAANSYVNMWRSAYELPAGLTWLVTALLLLLTSLPYSWVVSLFCLGLAGYRIYQAWGLYRFRISISGQRFQRMAPEEALAKSAKFQEKNAFWLGDGFAWTQREAQIAREILGMRPDEMRAIPEWMPEFITKHLLPSNSVIARDAIGASWIHGLNPNEIPLVFPKNAMGGHTLIVGTTGAGKTRLYVLLVLQAIQSGGPVIIVDPKGDQDLVKMAKAEAEKAGKKFLYFHPAYPSKSIRLNPLKNWHNPSEIASRIAQLLPSESGGGDSFTQFAWLTIDRIVNGMLMVKESPNLQRIKRYVDSGVDQLLERCFDVYFSQPYGPDWDGKLAAYLEKEKNRTAAMVAMYRDDPYAKANSNEVIEGLIAAFTHSKEHFSKMILSLSPLLQMLSTGELGRMLSPDMEDIDDHRVAYDIQKIVDGNMVLYVGLNSLSNKTIGSAIGSILLADAAAVAGNIYNFSDNPGGTNLFMFVDEAAEVVNDQFIQILNKGRGAGFNVFFATQTIADFEARIGSKAKALQMLGNANNLICLRVRDYETANFVAEMMGETAVQSVSVSHGSGTETEALAVEFRGSITRSIKEERAPLVSPDVLIRLPNLQFIAMIAGGQIVKGRLPLIL